MKNKILFIGKSEIYFQNVSQEVLNCMITFLEEPLRGPQIKCNEVLPTSRNKVEQDAIYTPKEKKRLKPNDNCIAMYGKNNEEAEEIASILLEMENRIMHACPVSADSLYDALLNQISHKKEKYKAFEMRKQFAYYLCKLPEIFKDIVEDHLKEGESYESFVLNMFQGLSYLNVDVVCAIVAKMWNTLVTVISPRGVEQKFHDLDDADNLIVIVWNGSEGVDCQYTATKPNFIEWQPIKSLDWSAPVKIVNNVKSANELAEKLFRKRSSDQIKKEYKRCSKVIIYMKEKLVKMRNQVIVMENQLDSMKTTIKNCTADIYKVEKTQT